MPHSLRAKLRYLTICGHIRKKDYERLCKALDNEGVLDKIKEDIRDNTLPMDNPYTGETKYSITEDDVLAIIDKYKDKGVKE